MAHDNEKKLTVGDKTAVFVHTNKRTLIIASVAILVIIVIIGTFSAISSNAEKQSMIAVEEAQVLFQEWNALESDAEDRESKAAELEQTLTELIDSTKKGYPNMKAQYLLGNLKYSLEQYSEAETSFKAVAETYKDMYLAPAAAMNLAVVYEVTDRPSEAVAQYQYVFDTYEDTSAEAPHALFAIGRIQDESGNTQLAVSTFQVLIADYPDSEWSKLANSRLVVLE
jgi:tetratricopeptide (TPR) repeat protein